MKRSMKTMAVLLAIVMSFAVVQVACAEEITGVITDLNTAEQWVVVNSIKVYCIPFKCFDNRYDFELIVGDYVVVEADLRVFPDGEKYIATEVCVPDEAACCDVPRTRKNRK